jgi:hypothetical protein
MHGVEDSIASFEGLSRGGRNAQFSRACFRKIVHAFLPLDHDSVLRSRPLLGNEFVRDDFDSIHI